MGEAARSDSPAACSGKRWDTFKVRGTIAATLGEEGGLLQQAGAMGDMEQRAGEGAYTRPRATLKQDRALLGGGCAGSGGGDEGGME